MNINAIIMVRLFFLIIPTIIQASKVSNFEGIQSLYGPNDTIIYEQKSVFDCTLDCQKLRNCVGFSISSDGNGTCEVSLAFPSKNMKTEKYKSFRNVKYTEQFTENVALLKDMYVENEETRMTLHKGVDGKKRQMPSTCVLYIMQTVRNFVGIDLHERHVISHGRVLSRRNRSNKFLYKHFIDVVVSVGDTRATKDTLFDNAVCKENVGGKIGWNNFNCTYVLTGRHIVLHREFYGEFFMAICEAEIYGQLLSEWTSDQNS